jgi:chromosome partitioning protein
MVFDAISQLCSKIGFLLLPFFGVPLMTMVRSIIVANEKGGVGKTTTAVNLAYGLAQLLDYKVLLVDLDPQASATISLGYAPISGSHDLLMRQARLEDVAFAVQENLVLVPSNHELNLAQPYLDAMEGSRGFGSVKKARSQLRDALGGSIANYDFVIVDCAPGLDIITINALVFGQEVLIPISLDFLSEVGTKLFVDAVAEMRSIGDSAKLRYIVPTFYKKGLLRSEEVLAGLHKLYGSLVTDPIRDNTHIAEAPARGKTIFEYKPNSPGAHDYELLTRKVARD